MIPTIKGLKIYLLSAKTYHFGAIILIVDTRALRRKPRDVYETSQAWLDGGSTDEDSGARRESSQTGTVFIFHFSSLCKEYNMKYLWRIIGIW